jgi:hypothetical protein
MTKAVLVVIAVLAAVVFSVRFAVSSSGFFHDGVMEGLQACKTDEDCIWVSQGCCSCEEGGKEILINREKERIFNLIVRDICFGKEQCGSEDRCHYEDVFCDRSCKFGKRTYTKPLLMR